MAFNEKIISADVVNILDVKILASSSSPAIGTTLREIYDSVLDDISDFTLSPNQKSAFGATVTTPSSTNPLVLLDDIFVYYTERDFGEIKDSVDNISDLPNPAVVVADAPVGSKILTVAGTPSVDIIRGQVVSGTGIPALSYIVDVVPLVTSYEIHINFEVTTSLVSENVSVSPLEKDLRAVMNERTVFKWDGAVWVEYVATGTVDHTSLFNLDSGNLKHITVDEKVELSDLAHTHINPTVLNQINTLGSGIVISVLERSHLPTVDYKDAMLGTYGVVSGTNRFVTNQDSRLNTIKNPYVTVGNDPSTTFSGSDIKPFKAALLAIVDYACTINGTTITAPGHSFLDLDLITFRSSGTLPIPLIANQYYFVRNKTANTFNISTTAVSSILNTSGTQSGNHRAGSTASEVKAIEVLPQVFTMYGGAPSDPSPLVWSAPKEGFLMESMTQRGATFKFRTFTDSFQILGPGTDSVTIRGINFELEGNGTKGLLIKRDHCVIENCTFTGITTQNNNYVGITIEANYVTIRNCVFSDYMSIGVLVKGNHVRIEECTFNHLVDTSTAIEVVEGENTKITACFFRNSRVLLSSLTSYCQVAYSKFNTLSLLPPVINLGVSNRILQSPTNYTKALGQGFVGKIKTVGPIGSYADFTGSTSSVLLEALADPNVQEIQLLPGTYWVDADISIPSGKKIKGTTRDTVIISHNSSSYKITINSDTSYENIVFSGLPGINSEFAFSPNVTNVSFKSCTFNSPVATPFINLEASAFLNFKIADCLFTGSGAMRLYGSTATDTSLGLKAFVTNNYFSQSLGTTLNLNDSMFSGNVSVLDVTSVGTVKSSFRSNYYSAPNKSSNSFTQTSVHYSNKTTTNLSDASVNNTSGYEFNEYDLLLKSRNPGAARSDLFGVGGISFTDLGDAFVTTVPFEPEFTILAGEVDSKLVLYWTSNVGSGSVDWNIDLNFWNDGGVATNINTTVVSPRTKLIYTETEKVIIPFTSVSFTRVSVKITRKSSSVLDTLAGNVVLLHAKLILPRT